MGDRLAVELEGALHIKQQESIIAQVCDGLPASQASFALCVGGATWAAPPIFARQSAVGRVCVPSRSAFRVRRLTVCDAASFPAQFNSCAQCEAQCQDILNIVDADVLSVGTEVFSDAKAFTKSTVSPIVKVYDDKQSSCCLPL